MICARSKRTAPEVIRCYVLALRARSKHTLAFFQFREALLGVGGEAPFHGENAHEVTGFLQKGGAAALGAVVVTEGLALNGGGVQAFLDE